MHSLPLVGVNAREDNAMPQRQDRFLLLILVIFLFVCSACGGGGGAGTNTVPSLTLSSAVSVGERAITILTASASDADGDDLSFSLGGADAGLFAISAAGVITPVGVLDYESPDDLDGNNVYQLTVIVDDGSSQTEANTAITVTDRDYGGIHTQSRFGGTGDDEAYAIAADTSGGYILVGCTDSEDGDVSEASLGSNDYWAMRIGADGEPLWEHRYGGSGYDVAKAVIATTDGGYLIAGESYSGISGDKTEASQGSSDYWAVKLDADGAIIWEAAYGGSSSDDCRAAVEHPDGGYLLIGRSYSGISGDKTEAQVGSYDVWLVRIDADGVLVWDATFGTTASEQLAAAVVTDDGSYRIAATTSASDGDKTSSGNGDNDVWLLAVDDDGTLLWELSHGGSGSDEASDLLVDGDEIVLAATSSSGISGSRTLAAIGSSDLWLSRFDADGVLVSQFAFGSGDADADPQLAIGDDGIVVVCRSDADAGGDKSQDAWEDSTDYWALLVDNAGSVLWDRRFGSTDSDDVVGAAVNNDGIVILFGTTNCYLTSGDITETGDGDYDWWVLRTGEGAAPYGLGLDATTVTVGSTIGSTVGTLSASDADVGDSLTYSLVTGAGDDDNISFSIDGESLVLATDITTYDGPLWRVRVAVTDSQGFTSEAAFVLTTAEIELSDTMRFGGSAWDNPKGVVETAEGGVIIVGFTDSGVGGDRVDDAEGGRDLWAICVGSDGLVAWEAVYGGSGDEFGGWILDAGDGGFLIASSTDSGISGDKTQASQGGDDFWVLKIDADGVVQWDARFGGTADELLTSAIATSDGGYLLGGLSYSGIGGDKTMASQGSRDYWVVKIDADGDFEWDAGFGTTGNDGWSLDVAECADGDFLCVTTSSAGISGSKTVSKIGGYDVWTMELSSSGILGADAVYGGSDDDVGLAMCDRSTGGVLIVGFTESSADGDVSGINQGDRDIWVLALDDDGSVAWEDNFGGEDYDRAEGVSIDDDGRIWVVGYSYSDAGGDRGDESRGNADAWVLQLDTDGSLRWERSLGGDQQDDFQVVLPLSSGGACAAGLLFSDPDGDEVPASNQGGGDIWAVFFGHIWGGSI